MYPLDHGCPRGRVGGGAGGTNRLRSTWR